MKEIRNKTGRGRGERGGQRTPLRLIKEKETVSSLKDYFQDKSKSKESFVEEM